MSRSSFRKMAILSLVAITVVACTPKFDQTDDPKRRLSEYISKSFAIKGVEEKDLLLSFLTGEVKERLQSWSSDQFREAFLDSRRQFLKLAFKEIKAISLEETQITYELTYLELGNPGKDGNRHESKVTQKKLCTLKLEKNRWYISEVKSIKELIEFKDELSLP